MLALHLTTSRSLAVRSSLAALALSGCLLGGCAHGTSDSSEDVDIGAGDSPAASPGADASPVADAAPAVAGSRIDVPAMGPGAEDCPAPKAFARRFPGARALAVSRLQLPVTGVRACSAKMMLEDGQSVMVTLGDDGEELDAAELLDEERVTARAKMGALRPELFAALEDAAVSENVSVWIWAKMHLDYPAREALIADPQLAQRFSEEAAAKAKSALQPIEDELAKRGIEVMERDGVSPYVRAVVPAGELFEIARMPEIMAIGSDDWPGRPASTAWQSVINAPAAQMVTTGAGQKVCVIEGGRPDDTSQLTIAATASPTGYMDPHIRWTSGIIRNTGSIDTAPDAEIYIGNWANYTPTPTAPSVWQWCTSNGARSMNFSWSFATGAPGGLGNSDLAMDYLTKFFPFPLFVPAAGNSACSPGFETVNNRGHNVLVVGGINDGGDVSTANDTMYACSAYKNPTSAHNDYELPHVVAPAVGVEAVGLIGDGTSGAAPQATGVAALLGSRNFNYNGWPELKRATILAASTRNVDAGSIGWLPTTDAKDGAGVLNAAKAVEIANPSNWRYPGDPAASTGIQARTLNMGPDFPPASGGYSSLVWNAVAPAAGRMRFVLTWDGSATCSGDLVTCSGGSIDADLDIRVFDSTGYLVCNSTSYDSTWEMCDIAVSAGQTYQIKIYKWNNNAPSTFMGLTWTHYTP